MDVGLRAKLLPEAQPEPTSLAREERADEVDELRNVPDVLAYQSLSEVRLPEIDVL